MTLGDVISAYRREHQLSMERFGELAGISKAYVSMLERNRTQRGDEPSPSFEMYRNVARAMGVDVEELIRSVNGKVSLPANAPEPPIKLPSNILPMPNLVKKPRLGVIACGEPILAEQNIQAYDEIPDWVKCDFTLVCKGDSMIGAHIVDGSVVCIRSQPEVEDGEIAAVLIDDLECEATLKRVKYYPDHIELRPENPSFRPLSFWDEEMNRVRVIGKAVYCINTL